MTDPRNLPVLAIVGPTGTGKSYVAMALSERLGAEIVSCDSVQVYRGFDIGSAKPVAAEQSRVKHHLVDVADWHEDFDAAAFRHLAQGAIADIRSRARLPILCGGTGLYLRALRYGLLAAPPVDVQLRKTLAAEERSISGSLHARLRALDPVSAEKISPNNIPHVMRALELCLQTGTAASVLRQAHGFGQEQVPMVVCWLDRDNAELRTRIAARVRAMLGAGWVAEVQRLLAKGVSPECRAMRAVGYREVVSYLREPSTMTDLGAKITGSTWHYARRQRTWWRRERNVLKFDMDQNSDVISAVAAIWERSANGT